MHSRLIFGSERYTPVKSDYLYISRDACRTNHDRVTVFWIVI